MYRITCTFKPGAGWRIARVEGDDSASVAVGRAGEGITILSMRKRRRGDFVNPAKTHLAAVRHARDLVASFYPRRDMDFSRQGLERAVLLVIGSSPAGKP